VEDNQFINTAPSATAVYDPQCVPAQLINNTFSGVDPPECHADSAVD
jgi:hypothetical protein